MLQLYLFWGLYRTAKRLGNICTSTIHFLSENILTPLWALALNVSTDELHLLGWSPSHENRNIILMCRYGFGKMCLTIWNNGHDQAGMMSHCRNKIIFGVSVIYFSQLFAITAGMLPALQKLCSTGRGQTSMNENKTQRKFWLWTQKSDSKQTNKPVTQAHTITHYKSQHHLNIPFYFV